MCDVCQASVCALSDLGAPISGDSITTTYSGNVSAPRVADVDALVLPYVWSGDIVTFGFAESGDIYDPRGSLFDEELKFLPLSDGGQDMMRDAVTTWADYADITLVETDETAQIRIAGSSTPSTAFAYPPDWDFGSAGDIWVGVDKYYNALFTRTDDVYVGSYEYYVAMHEAGHALGLKHPHEGYGSNQRLMRAEIDALENTIMSYRSYLGDSVGALTPKPGHFPQSLMMLDIAAIQQIYGADYSTNSGRTVYSFSPETGEMLVNGVSTGPVMANVVFRTLWDGGGTDEINLSAYQTSIQADLDAGGSIIFDTDNAAQRARLGGSNSKPVHATANLYMSLLHEGQTQSLIENIVTGSGDDIVLGNAASNKFTLGDGDNYADGRGGQDMLVITARSNSVEATLASGGDDLTLSFDGGTVTVVNVETLRFNDTDVALEDLLLALHTPQSPQTYSVDGLLSAEAPVVVRDQGDVDGFLFVDSNENGRRDSTDTALEGYTVFVDSNENGTRDAGEAFDETSASGRFRLLDVDEGDPSLRVEGSNISATIEVTADRTNWGSNIIVPPDSSIIGAPVSGTVFAELGSIGGVGTDPITIDLNHSFINPVVFLFVGDSADAGTSVPRVLDMGSDSLTVTLQLPFGDNRLTSAETLNYLVIEEGIWSLDDGTTLEVGTQNVSQMAQRSFAEVSFEEDYDTAPAVFTQTQTVNDADFVTTRQSGTTREGFGIGLEEEERNNGGHKVESIGWMAVSGGSAAAGLDVLQVEANSTGTEAEFNFAFDEAPLIFASVDSYNYSDPITAQSTDLTASGLTMTALEDTSQDAEMFHGYETINILALENEGLLTLAA